jgi:hypothetical protein
LRNYFRWIITHFLKIYQYDEKAAEKATEKAAEKMAEKAM